jgi:tetratricopeptide (TPR) repeat protein
MERLIGDTWRAQAEFTQARQAYDRAAATLAPWLESDTPAIWREQLALDLDRINLHLWIGQVGTLSDEQIARCQALLECYGTPIQRALGAALLLVLSWARGPATAPGVADRIEATIWLTETSDQPGLVAFARWSAGLYELMHGNPAAAETHLQVGLTLAESASDVQIQARCLTCLSIVARRRRVVDQVREYSARTLALATAYNLGDCLGAAHADMAWLAWRAGDLHGAEVHGSQALEHWRRTQIVYHMHWTARLPLLAVALEVGRLDQALDHARALLAPLQQRLAPALDQALAAALAGADQGEEPLPHLRRALAIASDLGYL